MKIRFRFRYNGLLITCIVLGVVAFFQQAQIVYLHNTMTNIQDSIPSVGDWEKHSQFMNRRCNLIEFQIQDVYATASTAYDIAYGNTGKGINNSEWMVGKTTEEISRILLEKRDADREKYIKMLDNKGGEK